MDPSRFTERRAGRLVQIASTGPVTHAFVPQPLPPDWQWPERFWPILLDARCALASLDGTGRHLPNPELLLRPLQQREALRSSSLEGTVTNPEQQLLFQIEPKYAESREDPVNALREVFNYGRALRLRQETREEMPLSLRLIRRLHSVLMDGVRGSESEPGEFRRIQVQIGSAARFVPAPPGMLMEHLDALEKYIHGPRTYDPLVEAFLVHYQFEAIHPFRDGNGRVGRLLLSVMIEEWCGLSRQWLYMSEYFDRNKDRYMEHLFRISTEGDWDGWVRFCLEGVLEQAKSTERRCGRLVELNRSFHRKVAKVGGSIRLSSIIDGLFETPVVQIPYLSAKLGVTYPTANADVRKLVGLGVLKQFKRMRQKTYYCPQIREVIYEEK
jgi:Fic family protein